MKLFGAFLVASLAALSGIDADASCRVVRSHVVVQEAVVVAPVATFFTVPVPAYSVGQSYGQDLTPLLEELRAMRLEMQQLRLGQVNGQSRTELAYVGLVRQNCAACHGVNPKGNKLSFFASDGAWKEPTPELLGDIIAMTASGKMPKDRKMSSEDRLALITGLTTTPAPEKLSTQPSPNTKEKK